MSYGHCPFCGIVKLKRDDALIEFRCGKCNYLLGTFVGSTDDEINKKIAELNEKESVLK